MTVRQACGWFGITTQAFYQKKQADLARQAEDQIILDFVRTIRQKHPKMGGRKLLHELQPLLQQQGIKRGRDQFFDLLRLHQLLVPHKRKPHRTTWAGRWRCPNRLDQALVTQPNQAWVADITYITTQQGFLYLALLTDLFSRYIVGYDLSQTLAVEGASRALDMALQPLTSLQLQGLIHHSDHGVQYTCHFYRQRLDQYHILPSMGEVGNCYDNAFAERVNGILKIEYNLDAFFVSHQDAHLATQQAIYLYNYERPHLSLNFQKPAHLYFLSHGVETSAIEPTTSEMPTL